MNKTLATLLVPPVLALVSVGAVSASAVSAGAVSSGHTMISHTWHGKITKIDAKMGSEDSFKVVIDMKTYTVDWNAMTKFEMGTSKDVKTGALVTVTGTLNKNTIKATKLSA
jgi:hypothetical protein